MPNANKTLNAKGSSWSILNMVASAAGIFFTVLEIWAIVRIFIIKGVTWGLASLGALLLSLLVLLMVFAAIKDAFSSIRNGRWLDLGLYAFLIFQNRDTLLPAITFFFSVVMVILIGGLLFI